MSSVSAEIFVLQLAKEIKMLQRKLLSECVWYNRSMLWASGLNQFQTSQLMNHTSALMDQHLLQGN